KGQPRDRSKCRNMIRLDQMDSWVDEKMFEVFGREPYREKIAVPGSGHDDEIHRIEQDVRDLDFDDPEYDRKHAALLAERTRVKALPGEPDRIEWRPTGGSIAEHWTSLDVAGRRQFLLDHKALVVAVKGADPKIELTLPGGQRVAVTGYEG